MDDYSEFFALEELLKQLPGYVPTPRLFNVSPTQLLREAIDRLAMPLPDGTPSPYSSRNPFTAEALLLGQVIFCFTLLADEANLVPDLVFLKWLSLWGIDMRPAEYPRILLRFYRQEPGVLNYEGNAFVPAGTKVENLKAGMTAITTEYREIPPTPPYYVDVPARLDKRGRLRSDVSITDFNYITNPIIYISRVEGIDILDPGRDAETLGEAVIRARQQMQMPVGLVTDNHYYLQALNLGAKKVLVLPGIQKQDNVGRYADLVTVIVHPPEVATYIQDKMIPLKLSGTRVAVHGADVVRLEGSIDASIDPRASTSTVLNTAVGAIREYIDPPAGDWGDRSFGANLAGALIRESPEIYGIPKMDLYSEAGVPLEELERIIQPWQLFSLKDTVRFNWLRGT